MRGNLVTLILSMARERGTRGSLVRGSAGSFALLVVKNILQLGVAVLLARILEPGGYGKYAFAMALVMSVTLFVLFGLPGLLTREVAAGEAREDWTTVRGLVRRADQLVPFCRYLPLMCCFRMARLYAQAGPCGNSAPFPYLNRRPTPGV